MNPITATSQRSGPGPVVASEDGAVAGAVMAGAAVVAVGAAVMAVGAAVVAVGAALPALAVAIRGDALAAVGAAGTIPVATLLLGYVVQVRLIALLPTVSAMETTETTEMLMVPLDAVKGPTVAGDEGRTRGRPVIGRGLGIGVLMVMGGTATEAGVAPVASTFDMVVPVMAELPRAEAADAIEVGRETVD